MGCCDSPWGKSFSPACLGGLGKGRVARVAGGGSHPQPPVTTGAVWSKCWCTGAEGGCFLPPAPSLLLPPLPRPQGRPAPLAVYLPLQTH